MNKNIINDEIEQAYTLLAKHEVAKGGIIKKTFRGQISSFGAAIVMGNLLAAIAYFSEKGGAAVERQRLMDIIYDIIRSRHTNEDMPPDLFSYANRKKKKGVSEESSCKEEILNAAIAVKLAMNLYKLEKEEDHAIS
ncbi:type III-B CRISPR module-associated protein Cmr5 [Schwartzia succinivorans]|jgi:CRISPR-associated protein Cmr5|uniref:CRISPR-associated protein Cmr5 n=1 Tax=Schwartzia succinivorans DSM 10502 TaxID=1123243 RepID=A0A1M4W8M9_9FIRM|nr:type III-B CRISPR module-associated protein Cmr5 [Schwartzia succinivorans]SHE77576.1 CRISPR-associated protein Cmr5 [Schwartzia succinivorans DSM 10502]